MPIDRNTNLLGQNVKNEDGTEGQILGTVQSDNGPLVIVDSDSGSKLVPAGHVYDTYDIQEEKTETDTTDETAPEQDTQAVSDAHPDNLSDPKE